MSVVGFIRRMRDAGMDWETAMLAAEAFEAEAQPIAPEVTARQARNKRYYHAKRLKASETSESKTLKTSKTVSDGIKTPEPPLAHVRDNLPRLVTSGDLTSPDSASARFSDLDWPETDRPSRDYLDRLQAELIEAGGPALASPAVAPKVAVLTPILALGREGKGPRCDLQADVLPTIRARAAKAPLGSIKSWDFFRDAILEARDRRLAGAPAMADVVHLRSTGPPRASSWDRAEEMRREGTRQLLDKLAAEE